MDKETIMQLVADGVISNEVAERYFPELKESVDEQMWKLIKKYAHNNISDMALNADHITRNQLESWLEKQGEQNHFMIQWKGDNLKEVIDFTGVYKEGFEKWFHNSWEEYEKYVYEHNNIFKIFNEDGSHIEVPVGAWIVRTPDGYNIASRYVFRQKPAAWSENDETYLKHCITAVKNYYTNDKGKENPFREPILDFLISLKDRIQPQPKHEWSEEDEIRHKTTLDDLEAFLEDTKQKPPRKILSLIGKDNILTQIQIDIDWFRTLKERIQPQNTWRPSDEQMKLLKEACDQHWEPDGLDPLYTLYQNLKKLREE